MNIGIFSDIHDRLDHLEQAMDDMHRLGCGHFMFLGDCTTPASFRRLLELTGNLPLDAVPGNNDYELTEMRRMASASAAARLHRDHALITRYGLTFSLSHYPKYALQSFRREEAEIILYGHTHMAEKEWQGERLIANPGELQGRTGRLGFGVLDTDSRRFTLHSLS